MSHDGSYHPQIYRIEPALSPRMRGLVKQPARRVAERRGKAKQLRNFSSVLALDNTTATC
jgi:hypothetical protein